MKLNYVKFFLILFVCATTSNAESNLTSDLSAAFQQCIPTKLKDDLELVHIENRCNDCKPWLIINYYDNYQKEPIKREIISVKTGYKAKYAYPNTSNFSNTNIYQSIPGQYENDKRKVIDAIKQEYERRKEQIDTHLKEHPELVAKIAPFKAKRKDYIELEENKYKGYEYISLTENIIGLTSKEISQIHIFVPEKQIIITAYLLDQKKANFTTISYFLKLREDFIHGFIDFIANNNSKLVSSTNRANIKTFKD